MLDDLQLIHMRDGQDALGIAAKQWQQLDYEFEPTVSVQVARIANIVYAGMGGSALAGMLLHSWPGLPVPFEIVRDYSIPTYVNDHTLFISSSYSGNTEEAVSALIEAEAKGAQIAITTAGGKLADIARKKNYPLFVEPSGYQPRHTLLYQFKALLSVLVQAKVLQAAEIGPQLEQAKDFLCGQANIWAPTVPTVQNQAKQIAQELMGKSVVVYAGSKLFPAAYKWKINCNENAKQIAWCNQYSELNHNEMLGWTKQPVDKPYAVVELRSNLEHPRIQKRFEVTERLLSGLRPEPIVVQAQGQTILEQMLSTIALGDFVSLYLAVLNGIDPTPVELIEKFKLELDK